MLALVLVSLCTLMKTAVLAQNMPPRSVTPSVTGQVVDARGKPLRGVPIEYEEVPDTPSFDGASRLGKAGRTNAEGRFTITKLSPNARYRFSFGGSYWNGSTQWGNTTYPKSSHTGDDFLRLLPGGTINLGRIIVYRASKTFSLVARTPAGKPAPGLTVTLYGEHTLVYGTTNARGRFSAPNVVDEPLTLNVYHVVRTDYSLEPGDDACVFSGPVRAGTVTFPIIVRYKRK